jgi:hypothetical protein
MSTILEAVGDYLQTNGYGTQGTDIFLAVLPESPDACIAIYEAVGNAPEFTMGSDPWAIDRPVIQVICRAGRGDYPTARNRLSRFCVFSRRDRLSLWGRMRIFDRWCPPISSAWCGMSDPYGRTVVTDEAPRCWRCNRVLAVFVTRPWALKCSRCKAENRSQ